MVMSMTGFASRRGAGAGAAWSWELRSVNGKGFDLRLRLPEGIDGLEPAVRAEVSRGVVRGSISLGLRLDRVTGLAALRVDPEALAAVLAALKQVETAALEADVSLSPASTAEVLAQRGLLTGAAEADPAPLLAALLADLPPLLADFHAMRAAEGRAMSDVLRAQVNRITALAAEARSLAEARRGQAAVALRESLDRLMANAEGIDAGRLAQELALLAVKSDVTEELDRLDAHVAAARVLLADAGPVGRKLDFLMQEFNREANTLCSKAQSADLTRVGLDLKVTIDQMREQVQNVE